MGKLLLLVTVCLISFNFFVPVKETELRQIFKVLMKDDATKRNTYVIDRIEKFSTKIIKQDNIKYVIGELGQLQKGVWTNTIFDSSTIVPLKYIDSVSKSNPREETLPHYRFSMPYFNKDKTTFIIYYNYYCGSLCAEYSLRLYKKVKGKWKFIKSFYTVVS
jgi:hypothetical protein